MNECQAGLPFVHLAESARKTHDILIDNAKPGDYNEPVGRRKFVHLRDRCSKTRGFHIAERSGLFLLTILQSITLFDH